MNEISIVQILLSSANVELKSHLFTHLSIITYPLLTTIVTSMNKVKKRIEYKILACYIIKIPTDEKFFT